MSEEAKVVGRTPAHLPRWWIFGGPILLAVIGTLGALYFLPPHCEKFTDTEICFHCLRSRCRETLCWGHVKAPRKYAVPLFQYVRSPREGGWNYRDPRQADCRHRYVTCWASELTGYGPFFTQTGWADCHEPGRESSEEREMRLNIWVRRDLLLLHGDVLDAAVRERFLATIRESLGQDREYIAAKDALQQLAPGDRKATRDAWLKEYFPEILKATPAPSEKQ